MRRLTLATCLLVVLPAPASAAVPALHADRGAHTAYGRPEFGEDTMSAFRPAFRAWGAVVEVDARLTSDGVPVAIHDATLERTTDCSGLVADRTLAQLAACRVDTIGSPGGPLGAAVAVCPEAVPTIAEVLADARDAGATVSLEIAGAAAPVMDVVIATGMPKERLIVQSFAPADLDAAKARLPGVPTSLLTLQAGNAGGPATASSKGYEWVSPEWPVDAAYVTGAQSLGRTVVPYTLHTAAQVQAAAALGVDALITDDVGMARRALGLPDGSDPGGLVCAGPPPLVAGPPVAEILVPALASAPPPRRACGCAGAGAATTTAAPRASSRTSGPRARAARRTGAPWSRGRRAATPSSPPRPARRSCCMWRRATAPGATARRPSARSPSRSTTPAACSAARGRGAAPPAAARGAAACRRRPRAARG